jgi:hypothetical protein
LPIIGDRRLYCSDLEAQRDYGGGVAGPVCGAATGADSGRRGDGSPARREEGGRWKGLAGPSSREGLPDPPGRRICLAEPLEGGPTRDHGLDFAIRRAPEEIDVASGFGQGGCPPGHPTRSARGAEPVVGVAVRRPVPVAEGGPEVRRRVVERAAAQDAVKRPWPGRTGAPGTGAPAVDGYRPGGHGRSSS